MAAWVKELDKQLPRAALASRGKQASYYLSGFDLSELWMLGRRPFLPAQTHPLWRQAGDPVLLVLLSGLGLLSYSSVFLFGRASEVRLMGHWGT